MGKTTYNITNKMVDSDKGTARKLPQYVAALSVCLGAVAAGTVLGWTSNIGDPLEKGDLNDVTADKDNQQGWIGSWMTLGAMIMCFPIGYLCDLLGRKLTMLLLIVPFTVGWLLIIFCANIEMIYVGRFILGLAGGSFCVSAPLYTSEIAEDAIRGTLGTFFQLLLVVGILMSNIMGAYVEIKAFSIICAIIPIIFGLVFFFQPETPVYLAKKGKYDEAKKSLERFRGPAYKCDIELEEIKKALEEEKNNKVSFMESLKTTASKKAILICFGLMFFQQLSGVNAFVFYTGNIFTTTGSSIDPSQATIYVGAVQLVATFVSSQVVDRFGRRVLLMFSDFFMMIASLVLAIYFSIKPNLTQEEIENIGWIPISSLIIFFIVFSLGYGPIPWLASSELMPQEIKANASSAAATFNWFLAFLVTKFYADLSNALNEYGPFYIFSAISLAGTAFVYFLLPETKGKSQAEIQLELSGGKSEKSGIDNPAYN
ncbi:facilitated trehalose transporter Tret1 isoform X1 [Aethina tumida]|uniref:facilitated trehalose transporter Tret1 isoform X1 n=1 Tax=Aethina tumida TaxID=116153 RepID=UPI00096B5C26|nr:facilitated trehalose transporter Tret1 isoform X1 [Aethina tumida]